MISSKRPGRRALVLVPDAESQKQTRKFTTSKGHWRRLASSTSDFDDTFEGLRFGIEGVGELFASQTILSTARNRQVCVAEGIAIVSGLRHVDMGVGMNHVCPL